MEHIAKYLLLMLSIIVFSGCQERYRYPCQDPAKIHSAECNTEICEETRTCPKIPQDLKK
jgi:hypothetical protein